MGPLAVDYSSPERYLWGMSTSVWTRHPRNSTAFRGEGAGSLVLTKRAEGWVLYDEDQRVLTIDTSIDSTLEAAIEAVDLLYPPDGWTRLDHLTWERGEWRCVSTANGWRVQHPLTGTRQIFLSADRARKWVDLRHDRPGGIRGPRLRSNSRASKTLPDVRVTVEERARFTGLATRLGMTFSELVRASLTYVEKNGLP